MTVFVTKVNGSEVLKLQVKTSEDDEFHIQATTRQQYRFPYLHIVLYTAARRGKSSETLEKPSYLRDPLGIIYTCITEYSNKTVSFPTIDLKKIMVSAQCQLAGNTVEPELRNSATRNGQDCRFHH